MKSFALLVKERIADPKRAVDETLKRLEKWNLRSGSTLVTLDEVAWLGAIFALGGIEAGKQIEGQISERPDDSDPGECVGGFEETPPGARVVNLVVTDTSPTIDRAGG